MSKKESNPEGRPRIQWPVFESIRQAAGALHYSEAEIKLCKNTGSKAFISGGRVDSGILIPDLNDLLHKASELPKGFTSWKEFGESRRAQLADVDLKKAKNLVMETADAKMQNGAAWGFIFAELERLCLEMPPALAGRPAGEIFERLVQFRELMRKTAKDKFEKAA
jgi:hypothetical protein